MYKRDLELDRKWSSLMTELQTIVGKRPKDLNGVLFLIGVQELGHGTKTFSKYSSTCIFSNRWLFVRPV